MKDTHKIHYHKRATYDNPYMYLTKERRKELNKNKRNKAFKHFNLTRYGINNIT